MNSWFRKVAATTLLSLTAFSCMPHLATAASPALLWPTDSVIYTIYPSIFSAKGDLPGVTAQLDRLKKLGVNTIWLMPITPSAISNNGHPNVGSPYSVHDYFAVNPSYGTPDDLRTLVSAAHKRGIKVLLDEVLNHTSWDNALITEHPEYYVHSDGDAKNPATIEMAFTYSDVAQLNYANPDLRKYMVEMLRYWITNYKVDGFRFDCVNNPDGPNRRIPADFWREMGDAVRQTKPDVLLLGEEATPDLALKPFSLDYAWRLFDALKKSATNAAGVQAAWQYEKDQYPAEMTHMSMQDNWDSPRDVNVQGGLAGARAAAVFNFTNTDVPLIYNGMEIGNAAGETNPHGAIDWTIGDPQMPKFYQSLIQLRNKNKAIRQGGLNWLTNSAPAQVLTYVRSGGGSEVLVEINLSTTEAKGSVPIPEGSDWKEINLDGAGFGPHTAGTQFTLAPKEFAIFERRAPKR
jgi:cyclomaltodextrinase